MSTTFSAKDLHLTLNTGAKIPSVGLGTWQSSPDTVKNAVQAALAAGYRHIDGAWYYQNEAEIGDAIRTSGVPREEIFVTGKLWSIHHRDVAAGLQLTLDSMKLDYLDLYLMHWPFAMPDIDGNPVPVNEDGSAMLIDTERSWLDTWKDMEALLETGKVKAIGVSNCSIPYLEELLKVAKVIPATNQIETHAYLPERSLVKYCQSQGIVVQAYSPLGSTDAPLLTEPLIVDIAKTHAVQPSQILISWSVQRGLCVLPKSTNPKRIELNLNLVKLSDEEMDRIGELHSQPGKTRRFLCPRLLGIDLKFDHWGSEEEVDAWMKALKDAKAAAAAAKAH